MIALMFFKQYMRARHYSKNFTSVLNSYRNPEKQALLLCFTREETKTQRGEVTCSEFDSYRTTELEPEPRPWDLMTKSTSPPPLWSLILEPSKHCIIDDIIDSENLKNILEDDIRFSLKICESYHLLIS